jgi:hypothetical protein
MRAPLVLSGVVAIALLAHARSLGAGFVYDDAFAVVDNPVVRGNLDLVQLLGRDFWGQPPGAGVGTWRPLPVLSFWLDWRTGGGAPWAFHLGNLLAHALASLALAWAARSPLAGAIFAAFAINTEAASGIVGRADIMAAGFCFLAWGLVRRSGPAAALAFLAALLCKESAVALPVWLLLVERRRAVAWLAAGALAYLALRAATFGFHPVVVSHDSNVLLGEPLGVRALTALHLLALALRLILAPVELSADYAFAALLPERGLSVDVALGVLGLAALLAAAVLARRRAPDVARGVAIFLVGFAAIANVAALLPALFAERLLYLPAAGIAAALAGALRLLDRRLAVALAALLVAGNLARSIARDADWKDDIALFGSAVETTPDRRAPGSTTARRCAAPAASTRRWSRWHAPRPSLRAGPSRARRPAPRSISSAARARRAAAPPRGRARPRSRRGGLQLRRLSRPTRPRPRGPRPPRFPRRTPPPTPGIRRLLDDLKSISR